LQEADPGREAEDADGREDQPDDHHHLIELLPEPVVRHEAATDADVPQSRGDVGDECDRGKDGHTRWAPLLSAHVDPLPLAVLPSMAAVTSMVAVIRKSSHLGSGPRSRPP